MPGGDSASGGRGLGFRMAAPGGGFNSIGAGSGASGGAPAGAMATGASSGDRGTVILPLGWKRRGSRPGNTASPDGASG